MEKPARLLLSYFPLLKADMLGEAKVGSEDAVKIQAAVEALPDGSADFCIWSMDDEGRAAPVLGVPDASAIVSHLKEWSEGEPGRWFKIHLTRRGDLYAVGLVPEVQLSVERHRIAFQLRHGYPLPADEVFQVSFGFLHCVAGPSRVIRSVEPCVPSRMKMGFVDSTVMSAGQKALDKAEWLGPFEVVSGPNPLLDPMIDDLESTVEHEAERA